MNQNIQKQIDWLEISRFNKHDAQSILKLASILKDRTVSQQMFEKLPKGYIAKLLKIVQTQLSAFEENKCQIETILTYNNNHKIELVKKAKEMEKGLLKSKQQIDLLHEKYKIKAETAKKLSQKIKALEKHKPAQLTEAKQLPSKKFIQKYYCPFCKSDEFANKDIFQFHIERNHSNGGANNEQILHKFMLEMKQKQLSMLELFLKKNQELNLGKRLLEQRQFSQNTNKFQQMYTSDKFNIRQTEDQDAQLKCSTEYVWFKKQHFQIEEEFPKYESERSIGTNTLNLNKVIKLENVVQKQTNTNNLHNLIKEKKSTQQHKPVNFSSYNEGKQDISLYKSNGVITDRSNIQIPSLKYYPNETSIYQENRSGRDKGYIYFCGPLLSDQSDSDVEDYFGTKRDRILIVDEDIVISQDLIKSFQKNEYATHIKKSPEKSQKGSKVYLPSAILTESPADSICDHDFSLSKDSLSINLSDLKLSKLQKEKQIERKRLESQNHKKQQQLINQKSVKFNKRSIRPPDSFLDQFYRNQKQETRLVSHKQYRIQQIKTIQNTQKQIKHSSAQIDILQQFYRYRQNTQEPNLFKKTSSKRESYSVQLVGQLKKPVNKQPRTQQKSKLSNKTQKQQSNQIVIRQKQAVDLTSIRQQDVQQSMNPIESRISFEQAESFTQRSID